MTISQDDGVPEQQSDQLKRYARFILPSLLGILLFLTPISYQEKQTIAIALISDSLRQYLGEWLSLLITLVFASSAIVSSYVSLVKPAWLKHDQLLYHLFNTTPVWLSLRVLGGIFCTMTYLQWGPDWVIGEDTGGVAYVEIAGIIFCIMACANLLLAFLTDFGFLEFIGTLITKPFRILFRLPGRAGLDALTSWVGDSSIGTILTIRQYESGHYSAREAAIVVTNFSAVSVSFCVVIAQMAKVDHVFVTFYLTVSLCGIVAALITSRLPPLSTMSNHFYRREQRTVEHVDTRGSLFNRALQTGLSRAQHGPGLGQMLNRGSKSILDIYFAVLPVAMTVEFIVLVIYYHTPVLQWISAPMVPVLMLLQVPEAEAAASGTLIGFFDQFIPAIIATTIDSPVTRFILAGLSVTQLLYIAENGVLILRSSIPLSFKQLAIIFLIRTIIVLPMLTVAGHLIMG